MPLDPLRSRPAKLPPHPSDGRALRARLIELGLVALCFIVPAVLIWLIF